MGNFYGSHSDAFTNSNASPKDIWRQKYVARLRNMNTEEVNDLLDHFPIEEVKRLHAYLSDTFIIKPHCHPSCSYCDVGRYYAKSVAKDLQQAEKRNSKDTKEDKVKKKKKDDGELSEEKDYLPAKLAKRRSIDDQTLRSYLRHHAFYYKVNLGFEGFCSLFPTLSSLLDDMKKEEAQMYENNQDTKSDASHDTSSTLKREPLMLDFLNILCSNKDKSFTKRDYLLAVYSTFDFHHTGTVNLVDILLGVAICRYGSRKQKLRFIFTILVHMHQYMDLRQKKLLSLQLISNNGNSLGETKPKTTTSGSVSGKNTKEDHITTPVSQSAGKLSNPQRKKKENKGTDFSKDKEDKDFNYSEQKPAKAFHNGLLWGWVDTYVPYEVEEALKKLRRNNLWKGYVDHDYKDNSSSNDEKHLEGVRIKQENNDKEKINEKEDEKGSVQYTISFDDYTVKIPLDEKLTTKKEILEKLINAPPNSPVELSIIDRGGGILILNTPSVLPSLTKDDKKEKRGQYTGSNSSRYGKSSSSNASHTPTSEKSSFLDEDEFCRKGIIGLSTDQLDTVASILGLPNHEVESITSILERKMEESRVKEQIKLNRKLDREILKEQKRIGNTNIPLFEVLEWMHFHPALPTSKLDDLLESFIYCNPTENNSLYSGKRKKEIVFGPSRFEELAYVYYTMRALQAYTDPKLVSSKEQVYLISRKWWNSWMYYIFQKTESLDDEDLDSSLTEAPQTPGPIDNYIVLEEERRRSNRRFLDWSIENDTSDPNSNDEMKSNIDSKLEVLGYMKYSADPWKQFLYHLEQKKLEKNYQLSGGMNVLREDLEWSDDAGRGQRENVTSSYVVLHSDTWSYLHRLYGGGPTIGRYLYHDLSTSPLNGNYTSSKIKHVSCESLRPETFRLLEPTTLGFKVDLYPILLRVTLHYRSQSFTLQEHKDIPIYVSPNVTSLSDFYITIAKQCLLPTELLQMNICEALEDSASFNHVKKIISNNDEDEEDDTVLDIGLSGRIWSRQKVFGPGNTEVLDWVVEEGSIFNDQSANSDTLRFNNGIHEDDHVSIWKRFQWNDKILVELKQSHEEWYRQSYYKFGSSRLFDEKLNKENHQKERRRGFREFVIGDYVDIMDVQNRWRFGKVTDLSFRDTAIQLSLKEMERIHYSFRKQNTEKLYNTTSTPNGTLQLLPDEADLVIKETVSQTDADYEELFRLCRAQEPSELKEEDKKDTKTEEITDGDTSVRGKTDEKNVKNPKKIDTASTDDNRRGNDIVNSTGNLEDKKLNGDKTDSGGVSNAIKDPQLDIFTSPLGVYRKLRKCVLLVKFKKDDSSIYQEEISADSSRLAPPGTWTGVQGVFNNYHEKEEVHNQGEEHSRPLPFIPRVRPFFRTFDYSNVNLLIANKNPGREDIKQKTNSFVEVKDGGLTKVLGSLFSSMYKNISNFPYPFLVKVPSNDGGYLSLSSNHKDQYSIVVSGSCPPPGPLIPLLHQSLSKAVFSVTDFPPYWDQSEEFNEIREKLVHLVAKNVEEQLYLIVKDRNGTHSSEIMISDDEERNVQGVGEIGKKSRQNGNSNTKRSFLRKPVALSNGDDFQQSSKFNSTSRIMTVNSAKRSEMYTPGQSVSYGALEQSFGRGCLQYSYTIGRGSVGLINLGNTCFMSAALQCLSHSPFLRSYLLQPSNYLSHINISNPLGSKGQILLAMANLMRGLWSTMPHLSSHQMIFSSPSSKSSVFDPMFSSFLAELEESFLTDDTDSEESAKAKLRKQYMEAKKGAERDFSRVGERDIGLICLNPSKIRKMMITHLQQFSGHDQHDSQEFLTTLLDRIHEDVNKVIEKPYVADDSDSEDEGNNGDKKKKKTKYLLKEQEELMSRFYGHQKHQKFNQELRRRRTMSYSNERRSSEDYTSDSNYNIQEKDNIEIRYHSLEDVAHKAWRKHVARNQSIVVDTFQGQFISTIFCLDCGQPSVKFDPFMFLATPIPLPPSWNSSNQPPKQEISSGPANSNYNMTGERDSRIINVFLMARVSKTLIEREILFWQKESFPELRDKKENSKDPPHSTINSSIGSNPFEDSFWCLKTVQYLVAVPPGPETKCQSLLEQISSLAHLRPTSLHLVQIYRHRIVKAFEPDDFVSSIGDEDILVVYERGIIDNPQRIHSDTKEIQQVKVKYTEDSDIVDGKSMTKYMDRENRLTHFEWPDQLDWQKKSEDFPLFAIGSRVDAKDYKGSWCAGSVIAIDKGKFKVHFDTYKTQWDEWYTEEDLFVNYKVLPLGTKTARNRPAFRELTVVQRRLVKFPEVHCEDETLEETVEKVYSKVNIKGEQKVCVPSQKPLSYYTTFGLPFLVQMNPARGMEFLFRRVVKQLLRYVSRPLAIYILACLHEGRTNGDLCYPFVVRLVHNRNPFICSYRLCPLHKASNKVLEREQAIHEKGDFSSLHKNDDSDDSILTYCTGCTIPTYNSPHTVENIRDAKTLLALDWRDDDEWNFDSLVLEQSNQEKIDEHSFLSMFSLTPDVVININDILKEKFQKTSNTENELFKKPKQFQDNLKALSSTCSPYLSPSVNLLNEKYRYNLNVGFYKSLLKNNMILQAPNYRHVSQFIQRTEKKQSVNLIEEETRETWEKNQLTIRLRNDEPALDVPGRPDNNYFSVPLSLQTCLHSLIKEERLELSDRWKCSHCKAVKVGILRQLIWKLPDLLVIHLKRFATSANGLRRTKLTTRVQYPLEGLDMSPLVHPIALKGKHPDESLYDLYGVINHLGHISGGHYTATCRNYTSSSHPPPPPPPPSTTLNESVSRSSEDQTQYFSDGMNSNSNSATAVGIEKINQGMKDISEGIWAKEATWLSIDDAEVSLLSSAEQVVTPHAYVLFYVRRRARTSNIIPDILDSSLDSILSGD